MKLEVLMSCMHQTDDALVRSSRLIGDVVVINQCDRDGFAEFATENGAARMICTTQRGLTKSRNLAVANSRADVCLLCDDDEVFVPDYEEKILRAYEEIPDADVIIFKVTGTGKSFPDRVIRLRFPRTMKVSSWQISFRRERLVSSGIRFDELLGAGTENGAEEELKFLTDCEKAGLTIYYAPVEIASVARQGSTWFQGFSESFFENRGATTRYILGAPVASLYAVYYAVRKRDLYRDTMTPWAALRATFRGIRTNKIGKQAKKRKKLESGT